MITPIVAALGTSLCKRSSRFAASEGVPIGYACYVPARPVQAGDETCTNRIESLLKDNRDRRRRGFRRQCSWSAAGHEHVDLAPDEIGRHERKTVVVSLRPAIFEPDVS